MSSGQSGGGRKVQPKSTCYPTSLLLSCLHYIVVFSKIMTDSVKFCSMNSKRSLPRPIETSSRSSNAREIKVLLGTDASSGFGLGKKPTIHLHSEKGNLPLLLPTESERKPPIPPNDGTSQSKHSDLLINPIQHRRLVRNGSSQRQRLPEPIETIRMSYRRNESESKSSLREGSCTTEFRLRRFTPQLIQTARLSFHGKTSNARYHSDSLEPLSKNPKDKDTTRDPTQFPLLASEPRFSHSSLLRRQEIKGISFRALEPPLVASNYSESSHVSELASLSPFLSSSELVNRPKSEQYRRESCDEQFSKYLLSLAARAVRKQSKGQALAVFPDEQPHRPIDHLGTNQKDGESQSDEEPASADLSWELRYMRQHKEEAEMRAQAMDSIIPTVATHQILNHPEEIHSDADGDWQNDTTMAHSTRPPRLGDDLIFPQSSSPEGTIYGNGYMRGRDQSYRGREGMWCANVPVGEKSGDGLWMGTCRKAGGHDGKSYETHLPGLITPVHDHRGEILTFSNGLDTSQHANRLHTSPAMKHRDIDDVDRKRSLQEDPEEEFHDGFVTQIYNYLSLGYPCVAHYYDHELSQISCIPVKELRRDDLDTDAKGYVSVTEDATVGTNTKSAGRTCMRWVALRLYIQDWARQQPRIAA